MTEFSNNFPDNSQKSVGGYFIDLGWGAATLGMDLIKQGVGGKYQAVRITMNAVIHTGFGYTSTAISNEGKPLSV